MRTLHEIRFELADVRSQRHALLDREFALEVELAEREARGRSVAEWEDLLARAEALEQNIWDRWEQQPRLEHRRMCAIIGRVREIADWIGECLEAAERAAELRKQQDLV